MTLHHDDSRPLYYLDGAQLMHPVYEVNRRWTCVAGWQVTAQGLRVASCPHYRYRHVADRAAWEAFDVLHARLCGGGRRGGRTAAQRASLEVGVDWAVPGGDGMALTVGRLRDQVVEALAPQLSQWTILERIQATWPGRLASGWLSAILRQMSERIEREIVEAILGRSAPGEAVNTSTCAATRPEQPPLTLDTLVAQMRSVAAMRVDAEDTRPLAAMMRAAMGPRPDAGDPAYGFDELQWEHRCAYCARRHDRRVACPEYAAHIERLRREAACLVREATSPAETRSLQQREGEEYWMMEERRKQRAAVAQAQPDDEPLDVWNAKIDALIADVQAFHATLPEDEEAPREG